MNKDSLEKATRAFLRVVSPSFADVPTDRLNAIDIDDSDIPVMDGIRAALEAYEDASDRPANH